MSYEPTPAPQSPMGMKDTSGQDRVVVSKKSIPWKWVVISLALIALFILLWPMVSRWQATEKALPRSRVLTAEVVQQTFTREVAAQGVVVAAVSPGVFAPTSGVVTLQVNAGDLVEKDQIIASLASPELNNRLALEESTLARLASQLGRRRIENSRAELTAQQTVDLAGVDLTAAKRELRRAEASWEKRVVSRQDYEKAVDDVARAELALDHAQRGASLEKESLDFELGALRLEQERQALVVNDVRRQVNELSLRAPVAGVVGTLAVDQKSNISENTLIANIVDLSRLEIEVRIPSSYSGVLAPGARVEVSYANQKHIGELASISPEINNNTVTARVSFGDSTPPGLRQNQRVSTNVLLEERPNALTIKRGAFFDDSAGRFVYVVNGDIAERRSIETGATSANQIEILAGLEAGETVIVSSYEAFAQYERILLSQ